MGQGPSAPEINDNQPASETSLPEDSDPVPPYQPPAQFELNDWLTCDEKGGGTTCSRNLFIYGSPITADIRPKNVILFGETGVGKSSTINLMAGIEVTRTSRNLESCTFKSTEHSFSLIGETEIPFHIYDTVGLNEPKMGADSFLGAVEKAHQLLNSLADAGGVDLLLFCIRGSRITDTLQRNYRLFAEVLGERKIPVAIVVTQLEFQPDRMESWWETNEQTLRDYGINSVAHACITALPVEVTAVAKRRKDSLFALHHMLRHALSIPSTPYVLGIRGWFIRVLEYLWSILMMFSWLKKKYLSIILETRCGYSQAEARELVDMLTRGR